MTNVLRIVSLGGSIYRILRRLEAPGGPDSNVAKRSVCSGGVSFKTLRASSEVWRVWRLEVQNVLRIVALEAPSIVFYESRRLLRAPDFAWLSAANIAGGSA